MSNTILACFCLVSPLFYTDVFKNLLDAGIHCRKYYKPLSQTTNASKLYEQILCIPCTIDMSTDDIDLIVSIIGTSI